MADTPTAAGNDDVIGQAADVIRSCGTNGTRHSTRVNPARAARVLAERGLLADSAPALDRVRLIEALFEAVDDTEGVIEMCRKQAEALISAGMVTAPPRIPPTSDSGYDAGSYVDELARLQDRINAALAACDGWPVVGVLAYGLIDDVRKALTDPTAKEAHRG